jgi:hypothetical protein
MIASLCRISGQEETPHCQDAGNPYAMNTESLIVFREFRLLDRLFTHERAEKKRSKGDHSSVRWLRGRAPRE